MTDASPGPGWWLASDGNWYPPHLHPDVRARPDEGAQSQRVTVDTIQDAPEDAPEEPAEEPVATTDDEYDERGWVVGNGNGHRVDDEPSAQDAPVAAALGVAPQYVPEREPIDWAKVAAERSARRQANESRRRRKFVGATLASIGTLAVLVAVARNDGNDDRGEQANSPAAATTTEAPTSSEAAVTTTSAAVTATTVPGSVSVFTLLPGTCVSNADLTSGLVTTVAEVPCDQPHTHEVYHKVTYTPPDGAYNAERISQFASEQCSQSFASYVGIPYDRSKYYFLNFAPTEESWTQKGDREVVCLLFLQGSQLTGSAKGTAQ
jgi:hypothetical protein